MSNRRKSRQRVLLTSVGQQYREREQPRPQSSTVSVLVDDEWVEVRGLTDVTFGAS